MIADWSELIAEVVTRTGDGSVATRAEMLTGFAENDLNRRLRMGPMETQTTLTTDADGTAYLPSDFLQMRRLMVGTNNLTGCTYDELQNRYYGYSTVNGTLKTRFGDTDLSLAYYAKLPGLVENCTNWLLEMAPELYLVAIQRQAYVAKLDVQNAQLAEGAVASLIQDLQHSDFAARMVGSAYTLEGPTP
jgi:hypothetical protein